ncbi:MULTISPECIES: hypothetical protein [Cupriavidus]|nr:MULTISPECIES: hypothetical protein [Cupriavidus]QYY33525.1 hypothetical protein K2O51_24880 [Cupriavidus pinatubonensis]
MGVDQQDVLKRLDGLLMRGEGVKATPMPLPGRYFDRNDAESAASSLK